MTTISTTADLLRLLREDPDFRDEVRRLLLTQELIELPERFARFEAYVERRFTEIGSDITEIRGDIARNTSDIARNTSDIAEIRGDLGRLKGAEYERRVGRSFASYGSMAFRQRNDRSLRRNRLLYSASLGRDGGFEELIGDSVDSGLISDDERAELEQADAVMSGQDGGASVYFLGEFSVTVNHTDIDRAIARSATLSKVTNSDVWPMVIGDTIPDPQLARAEAEGVAFRQVAE